MSFLLVTLADPFSLSSPPFTSHGFLTLVASIHKFVTLSSTDLRETAYEIFVAACRTSTGKALSYTSSNAASAYTPDRSSQSPSLSGSPSQRSITYAAASKMKKALGLRSSSSAGSPGSAGSGTGSGGKVKKTVMTVGELMRIQMKISASTNLKFTFLWIQKQLKYLN